MTRRIVTRVIITKNTTHGKRVTPRPNARQRERIWQADQAERFAYANAAVRVIQAAVRRRQKRRRDAATKIARAYRKYRNNEIVKNRRQGTIDLT